MICLECDGRGEVWDEGSDIGMTTCEDCHGTGEVEEEKEERDGRN